MDDVDDVDGVDDTTDVDDARRCLMWVARLTDDAPEDMLLEKVSY